MFFRLNPTQSFLKQSPVSFSLFSRPRLFQRAAYDIRLTSNLSLKSLKTVPRANKKTILQKRYFSDNLTNKINVFTVYEHYGPPRKIYLSLFFIFSCSFAWVGHLYGKYYYPVDVPPQSPSSSIWLMFAGEMMEHPAWMFLVSVAIIGLWYYHIRTSNQKIQKIIVDGEGKLLLFTFNGIGRLRSPISVSKVDNRVYSTETSDAIKLYNDATKKAYIIEKIGWIVLPNTDRVDFKSQGCGEKQLEKIYEEAEQYLFDTIASVLPKKGYKLDEELELVLPHTLKKKKK